MNCREIKGRGIGGVIGDSQYIYTSDKGEISLINLTDHYGAGEHMWEIYCLKGNLFDDVRRFESKEEAEVMCKGYLD